MSHLQASVYSAFQALRTQCRSFHVLTLARSLSASMGTVPCVIATCTRSRKKPIAAASPHRMSDLGKQAFQDLP